MGNSLRKCLTFTLWFLYNFSTSALISFFFCSAFRPYSRFSSFYFFSVWGSMVFGILTFLLRFYITPIVRRFSYFSISLKLFECILNCSSVFHIPFLLSIDIISCIYAYIKSSTFCMRFIILFFRWKWI